MIFTVFTDIVELYRSRLEELTAEPRRLRAQDAAADLQPAAWSARASITSRS